MRLVPIVLQEPVKILCGVRPFVIALAEAKVLLLFPLVNQKTYLLLVEEHVVHLFVVAEAEIQVVVANELEV